MALPKHGKFPVSLWSDPEWCALSIEATLVGVFLVSFKNNGPWPAARISRVFGIDRESVEVGLDGLRNSKFSEYVQTEPRRKRMSAKISRTVFARDGRMCVHCGTSERLTVDHIWPVSKGGADDLDNLQTLCHSCNSKKGARTDGLVQG